MVPKIDELNLLAAFMSQNFKEPMDNVKVVFSLSETELKKMNEELFYKTGNSGKEPEISDEILVNGPNGLVFVFEKKTPDE